MAMGAKPDGEPLKFGVRDPRGGGNDYIAVVTLSDTTMATSGDYERYFERDGVRYHHILDPATGRPADTGLMSVSVVSPDGALADSMSTWLFIKGRTTSWRTSTRSAAGWSSSTGSATSTYPTTFWTGSPPPTRRELPLRGAVMKRMKYRASKVAFLGLLFALSVVLSLVESSLAPMVPSPASSWDSATS